MYEVQLGRFTCWLAGVPKRALETSAILFEGFKHLFVGAVHFAGG